MPETPPSYADLERRCLAAESMLRAIRSGETDTVLGDRGSLVVRLAEAEERATHIKQVLLAIRRVNQLIVQETDQQQLIERTCACLTDTLGYLNAWVVLLDEDGLSVSATAASGFQFGFELLREQIEGGDFVDCMRAALASDELVVVADPTVDCKDCPLACNYKDRAGLVRCLSFEGKKRGVLAVSVPARYAADQEERELFEEVAGDLAFALHKIEMDELRKAAEREVTQTLASITDAFFALDKDLVVTYFNAAAERGLGRKAEEVVGKPLFDVFPEARGSIFEERYRKAILTGQSDQFETYFEAHRQWYEVRVYPRDRGISVYFFVTTEKREAGERLAHQTHYLQTILQTTRDGFWVIDTNGRFSEVNEAYCHMSGYTRDEFLQLGVNDIDADEEPDETAARILHITETGSDLFETRHRRKDGTIFDVEVSVTWLPDSGGRMVCFARDITERRRETEEREINLAMLRALSQQDGQHDLLREVSILMRNWSGCEAVGIRLKDGEDYPYHETSGFPESFVRMENNLCAFDEDGQILRDSTGNPVLECMCGNVIRGRINPALPFFTEYGSFWTNSTTDLLASTSEEDRQARTRNRCHGEGYESVALVPLRYGGETIGLLQFNDPRRDRFDKRSIVMLERLASSLAVGLAQRRSAVALRESEERFRMLIEGAPVAVLAMRDGRFVFGNQAAARMLGFDHSDAFIGLHVLATIAPGFRERVAERMRRLSASAANPPMEMQLLRADGTLMWSLSTSVPIILDGLPTVLIVGQDITDRKEAEEALRESEERYRALVNHMQDVVWRVDRDGVFTFMSPAASQFGREPEELLGKPFEIVLTEESASRCRESLKNRREGLLGTQPLDLELEHVRADGSTFIGETRTTPVFDTSGELVEIVGITRDVTWRIQAEEAQARLEEQFRQSQKMEAIGQLTGGVAHDFNNLLQVINGGTDLALSELGEEHPAVESLREVARAGERAAWLVGQLLLFSRRQIMRPATLDLNESVTELLKMLRRVIGEQIRVEWIPGQGVGSVHADRGMVEQALMNLCVNARDAMPGGGVLTIETLGVVFDSEYCASHMWAKPGRYILLSVTDTGCGMDRDTLDHIFEPFFTTKEEGKGTGLGLATVYGIAQQHGGMVTVYSEPGKGSTFKVYLPQCERPAGAVGTLITGPAAGGTETLLIAEDDETVRRLARRVLERAGYTVIAASDGREAVALFRENMDQISLVILDVVMPEMGGGEAYERMRELCPDLKALFASGYSENAIHTNFVLHEGIRLIQKPYSVADLLRTLRALLDGNDHPDRNTPE